jgi:hypothetical protein
MMVKHKTIKTMANVHKKKHVYGDGGVSRFYGQRKYIARKRGLEEPVELYSIDDCLKKAFY